MLFEAQTKACRPEVLAEIKDELRRLTINWAAVRDEKGVQGVHKTDFYLAKLYEVLVKGSTQHATPDRYIWLFIFLLVRWLISKRLNTLIHRNQAIAISHRV